MGVPTAIEDLRTRARKGSKGTREEPETETSWGLELLSGWRETIWTAWGLGDGIEFQLVLHIGDICSLRSCEPPIGKAGNSKNETEGRIANNQEVNEYEGIERKGRRSDRKGNRPTIGMYEYWA